MERRGQFISLTPTQEGVAQSVLSSLKAATDRALITVDGLSGVGKTLLLRAIEPEATRVRMFNCNYRKVGFWHRDFSGYEFHDPGMKPFISNGLAKYQDAYQEGGLLLKPSTRRGKISFMVHAHDHPGLVGNPTLVGWMAESLLQQRAIAYYVNNGIYGAGYVFNPETNHIQILPKRVD